MDDNLHLVNGHLCHVHLSSESFPPYHRRGKEATFVGTGVVPWDLQHRSRAALRSPPGDPLVCQVRLLGYLCLVQDCEGSNFPAVLQVVNHVRGWLRSLLELLVLLSLLPLPLAWLLVVGAADETF